MDSEKSKRIIKRTGKKDGQFEERLTDPVILILGGKKKKKNNKRERESEERHTVSFYRYVKRNCNERRN